MENFSIGTKNLSSTERDLNTSFTNIQTESERLFSVHINNRMGQSGSPPQDFFTFLRLMECIS